MASPVIAGTGAFSTTANIQGGFGGNGGDATFNSVSSGYGTGSYSGGNGGDGGVGVSEDRGDAFTVASDAALNAYGLIQGGNGGYGGSATLANGYGTMALGYGGIGGAGGAGILLLAPSTTPDPGAPTVTIDAQASVTGGNGGFGANGTDYGGTGGGGGDGIRVLNGGSIDNSGTVSGGFAGFGGSGGSFGGAGGSGGNGILIVNGGSVQNENGGSIQGGNGNDGGTGAPNSGTSGGSGGAGGAGISLSGGGSIQNFAGGTITGGQGGLSDYLLEGEDVFEAGAPGQGGAGVVANGTATVGATVINAGRINGGFGGTSYDTPPGGSGGAGISGGFFNLTNSGMVNGGQGGAYTGGAPGTGGPGVSASNSTITNTATGTISGGDAGSSAENDDFRRLVVTPSATGTDLSPPDGGVGIVGSDLYVINAGTIQPGASSESAQTQTVAIQFTGGTNTLELYSTSMILGQAIASSSADTLALGGPTDGTLDVGNIGAANSGAAYQGFGVFEKLDGSTWTLQGTTAEITPWQILGGTLAISSDANLGAPSGSVTLNGGTLETTANITSARAFIVGPSGGGINTDAATTLILQGTVSGNGQLTKLGTGTLQLLVNNSYSGGTLIDAGTVAIATAQGLGSGPVTMAAGTQLSFLNSLTFQNPVAFTGAADPTIDTGPNTVVISSPITGNGDLTKIGSGILDLTGASTYTGATTISAGTLLVDGSITSTVTVDPSTNFGGFGIVGGLIVAGGTVSPGYAVPYSTLRVAGNVTIQSGSTYTVHINGSGQTDRIAASGTATLGGGTVNVLAASGVYSPSQTYTILSAAGGRTGTFSNLTTTNNLAFLQPYLTYTPNSVVLGLISNGVTPVQVGSTPNQQATGSGIPPSVFGLIQGLSTPSAQQALDALSGEGHASVQTAAVQAAQILSTAIFDRLWNIGGATGDAYDVLQGFGAPLPTLLRCYAPGDTTTREILSSYSVWAVGLGDFGHFGGNGNAAALDTTLGGFIGGADMPVYAGSAIWRFGIAGGYASDDITVRDRSTSGTFESVFGSLYGGVRVGAFDARFGAGVAGNNTDLQRTVAFPGFSQGEHSSYGGMTVQGFGEIGYRFSYSGKVFEPVAGFTAISVHQDGFHEDGGLAALRGRSQDTDVQTSELGFRAEATPFAALPLVARLHLAWQHSFGDLNPAAVLAFEAGGSPFQVTGAPIDHDAALIEAGADYRATGALTVGLNYVGTIGPRDQDHSIRGRVEYRF